MDETQFCLVVYDISNDRRRTKLHDRLLDFGVPVQYSVFECRVTTADYAKMKNMIREITRPRSDSVRVYAICKECLGRVELLAGSKDLTTLPGSQVV